MNFYKTFILSIFLLLIHTNVYGSESDKVNTSSGDFQTGIYEDEVYDPLEPINRIIFGFNNVADKIILEPTAKGYKKLPSPVQSGISNFLNNLKLPLVVVNQILQGQLENATDSTGRFLVNSTAGVFGLIDVAEKIGLEQTQEDFGQTLATWGVGDGFYLDLPIFGPSNIRDTAGMILTYSTDPVNAYAITENEAWILPVRTATNAIDQRSKIIDEVNALRDNSLDYYAAVRSSYYQNRKAAILNNDDNEQTPLPLISIEFE
jgi:phospholipid-binding lipoprotein MlaA